MSPGLCCFSGSFFFGSFAEKAPEQKVMLRGLHIIIQFLGAGLQIAHGIFQLGTVLFVVEQDADAIVGASHL